jgi:hypothetical protein
VIGEDAKKTWESVALRRPILRAVERITQADRTQLARAPASDRRKAHPSGWPLPIRCHARRIRWRTS